MSLDGSEVNGNNDEASDLDSAAIDRVIDLAFKELRKVLEAEAVKPLTCGHPDCSNEAAYLRKVTVADTRENLNFLSCDDHQPKLDQLLAAEGARPQANGMAGHLAGGLVFEVTDN